MKADEEPYRACGLLYNPRAVNVAVELTEWYAGSAIAVAKERCSAAIGDGERSAFWRQVCELLDRQPDLMSNPQLMMATVA